MDILNPQKLDANRGRQVFKNIHDRMRMSSKKTDELYVEIVVDEVNKYFNSFEYSTINSSDLPDERKGPDAAQHNELISSVLGDIDKVKSTQRTAEDLVTKAVNYMSSEREGILESASKLQSRIVTHKLRHSMNDRNLISFVEYFNDYGMTDLKKSIDIEIDSSRSSLCLAAAERVSDNSSLIDPNSIEIVADIEESFPTIYPLSSSKRLGYGQRLFLDSGSRSKEPNVVFADSENETRISKIRPIALKTGIIGDVSSAQFELIDNPGLVKVDGVIPLLKDIRDSLNLSSSNGSESNQVVIDVAGGRSFGATSSESAPDLSKIKRLFLKFKLLEAQSLAGKLSKVVVSFVKPGDGGFVPSFSSALSSVNGITAFVSDIPSKTNDTVEKRTLFVMNEVDNPKEFSLAIDLEKSGRECWKSVGEYYGLLWEFNNDTNDINGIVSYGSSTVAGTSHTASKKTYYVYHDWKRGTSEGGKSGLNEEENRAMAREILGLSQPNMIAHPVGGST